VLASGAPRYEAWGIHIYLRLGKALYGAAVGTLFLRRCDIHSKYSAQFTCGSIAVQIVGVCSHFFPPVGPKRSVLILPG
jgi:hypothetical protein